MNINPERFPTYKPLSPVLRTQTTYVFGFYLFLNMVIYGCSMVVGERICAGKPSYQ